MNSFLSFLPLSHDRVWLSEPNYSQAPPFLDAVVSAIEAHLSETEGENEPNVNVTIETEDEGNYLASFESIVGKKWYTDVFLTRTKFTEHDEQIISEALLNSAHLEDFEIDRLDYEREVNNGHSLIERLGKIGTRGQEVLGRMPTQFKGDKVILQKLLNRLPTEGQLDLVDDLPTGSTKTMVYRLLRWIEAFPPLHREISNGKTVICSKVNCDKKPKRIPGIGFQFQTRKTFPPASVKHNKINIRPTTPVEAGLPDPGLSKATFTVLANDREVQNGSSTKVTANFSCKKIAITSELHSVVITRFVKTFELPFGAVEFQLDSNRDTFRLEDQISRAWWFDEPSVLVFATQSDQVYTLGQDGLKRVGEIPFSNYGIDCVPDAEFASVVISSWGEELLVVDLAKGETQLRTLETIPVTLWPSIFELLYAPSNFGVQEIRAIDLPKELSEIPISRLRWFEYKIEKQMKKQGIVTVGDLLHTEFNEVSDRISFGEQDLKKMADNLFALITDTWLSDLHENAQLGIWESISARGWVEPLPAKDSYTLPRLTDYSVAQGVRLPNKIVSLALTCAGFEASLDTGVILVLSREFSVQTIKVKTWQPNRFLLRRAAQVFEKHGYHVNYGPDRA